MNASTRATIYVSQSNGNDGFSGYTPTKDGHGNGPVKSIDRALKMIKTMRVGGLNQPISIKIIGDYYLDSPIRIGAKFFDELFGEIDYKNVVFESAPNQKARIIGGRKITNLKKDTINGMDCFSAQFFVNESEAGEFSDIYVNGRRATLARYPEKGTLRAVTSEYPRLEDTYGSKWFVAIKEDLKEVRSLEGAIISFSHQWIDEHSPIESYDKETGKITLKYRSAINISTVYENSPDGTEHTTDLRYCIENIAEGMMRPDDWYYDKESHKLYYIPRDKEMTVDNVEIVIPTTKHIIEVCGTINNCANAIRIRNLELCCTDGTYVSPNELQRYPKDEPYRASDVQSWYNAYGALYFEYAKNCSVESCYIHDTGIHAIEISAGCQEIRVEKCNMYNLGGGGVKIKGRRYENDPETPYEQELTAHCKITNNKIMHCGERYAAGCGVLVIHSSCNEISDNEISHLEYSGISVGWNWSYSEQQTYGNIIRRNHIHHILGNLLSDLAGIYLLGVQDGTIVEGNHIHDIHRHCFAGSGIYTDEGSSHITIENNLVYRMDDNCFQQNFGKYNIVRNNIFAFANEAIIRYSQEESHVGAIFNNNIFLTNGTPIYRSKGNLEFPNEALSGSDNIIWDISGEPKLFGFKIDFKTMTYGKTISLEELQKYHQMEIGSIVANPEFVDFAKDNYRLSENSPAFKLGFCEFV